MKYLYLMTLTLLLQALMAASTYDDLSSELWYFNNQGLEHYLRVDSIDQIKIIGQKGQDLQIHESFGPRKIKVAMIDSGVDIKHPLFLEKNYHPKLNDRMGHGTHIASLILGMKKENHNFIDLKVYPVRLSSQRGDAGQSVDQITSAIKNAIKDDVDIINMSLGWRDEFNKIQTQEAIKEAIEQGIVIIASAGNSSSDQTLYPCAYDQVLCIGSFDPNGERSHFSQYGHQVSLYAPGFQILGAWPTTRPIYGDLYKKESGTSQASALTTHTVARLLSHIPHDKLSKKQIFSLLHMALLKEANTFEKHEQQIPKISYKRSKKLIENYLNNNSSFNNQTYFQLVRKKPYILSKESNQISIELKSLTHSKAWPEISKIIHNSSKSCPFEIQKKSPHLFELKIILCNDFLLNQKNYKTTRYQDIEIQFQQQHPLKVSYEKTSIIQNLDLYQRTQDFLSPIKGILNKTLIELNDHTYALYQRENQSLQFILTQNGQKEFISPLHELDLKNYTLIHSSLKDINLDGIDELIFVFSKRESNNLFKTQFKIFNSQNGLASKLEIVPKNTFAHENVIVPGKFLWAKHNNSLRPTWIVNTKAINDSYDPWNPNPRPVFKSRLLALSPQEGLVEIQTKDHFIPLHFLMNQNDYDIHFISFNEDLNRYAISKIDNNQVVDLTFFKPLFSMNLSASARPLPVYNKENLPGLLFYENELGRKMGSLSLTYDEVQNKVHQTFSLIKHEDLLNPMVMTLKMTQDWTLILHKNDIRLYSYSGENLSHFTHHLKSTAVFPQLNQNGIFSSSSITGNLLDDHFEILEDFNTYQLIKKQSSLNLSACLNTKSYARFLCEDGVYDLKQMMKMTK